MYIEKLKVMNMISDRVKHDNTQLELIDIKDDFFLSTSKFIITHEMLILEV